jgi:hypothetical protein
MLSRRIPQPEEQAETNLRENSIEIRDGQNVAFDRDAKWHAASTELRFSPENSVGDFGRPESQRAPEK